MSDLWQGGHPYGSERVGKVGILRAMFEVSEFRCIFKIMVLKWSGPYIQVVN